MDTLTSRLLCSTNFWSMWKMVRAASMWSEMSHKSCFISSMAVAEKDELLFSPHLIHMSICLLSVPLSKDYWCPVFDIWHIRQSSFSSSELTQRGGEKNANLTAISRGLSHCSFVLPWPPCLTHHPPHLSSSWTRESPPLSSVLREPRASRAAKFGGKLFIWPLLVSAFYNLEYVTPVPSA